MKTELPIVEQDGFHIWLPSRVRLTRGTVVEPTETGIRFRRNDKTLRAQLAERPRDALLAALDEDGGGMPTEGLAVVWRKLLDRLATVGMLADAEPSAVGVPGLDAIAAVLDAIHTCTLKSSSGDSGVKKLIAGQCGRSIGPRWLVENYHFTKSAKYHVPPVLGHDMSTEERRLWTRLLEDELWHWRIYRPAAAQFGWRLTDLDDIAPAERTTQLIEVLHAAAAQSPIVYSAAMMLVEKPPDAANAIEDPLYSSLMTYYGFSPGAIRPIWWHQVENAVAGHSDLGAVVLSNRRIVDPADLDAAIAAISDVVDASRRWYDHIAADC